MDAACGAGRHAVWLAEHGWNATACDVSLEGLRRAQTLALERGVRLSLYCHDLEIAFLWDWDFLPSFCFLRFVPHMKHPLETIWHKIERANEHILDLEHRITIFVNAGPGQIMTNYEPKATQEFIDAHERREIPNEFSLLAGEVVYHLRSSLDHLAWELVKANGGTPSKKTAFPIYCTDIRANEKELPRYEGKIQGMSISAKAIIERLQPYHGRDTDPCSDPLWILHDLNNADKHQALLLISTAIHQTTSSKTYIALDILKSKTESAVGMGHMHMNDKVTAQISFAQFGLESEPVIPGLLQLFDAVAHTIGEFTDEF